MTQGLIEEMKQMVMGQLQGPSACFGMVVSQDNDNKMLKVILEPYGVETGWLRVLKWPYLPIVHSPHTHNPPPGTTNTENEELNHEMDEFSSYRWVGKEVVVLMLYSDINNSVVLGPLW